MSKNIINFFHSVIIAGLLLSVSGCGFKGPPVYVDDTKKEQQQTKK